MLSALHFDFGVEQACSAAARVLLACPSRASLSSASRRSVFLPYEAFPHAEERRLRICASCGSALPSSGPTSSFLSSSMRVKYLLGGGRMCFPDRDCRRRPESHCIFHRSCLPVPRSLFLSGRPDEFSQSRLSTSTSPLLHSTILLISTRSSCASVAWGSTVYGVAILVIHFEARKGGSVGACALVCAVLHPRARTQETGQATPGVTVACLVFWKSFTSRGGMAHIWTLSPDGCNRRRPRRARIPAEFRARVFKPLGASGALREGLKTASGGRLASSAGV